MRHISPFDSIKRESGSEALKLGIHIIAGPGDNDFMGVARVSTRDLQDKETATSETRLEGKRIQVEPF
jgi:hypothetical protein